MKRYCIAILLVAALFFAAGRLGTLVRLSPRDGGTPDHELDPLSVTLFTSKLLLFMEYPHLVVGQPAAFLAHLSVLETGEPVRAGEFTLEAVPENGPPVAVQLHAPKREGLYIPEVTFLAAGEYEARIVVSGPHVSDSIPLGQLMVHSDEKTMLAAAEAAPSGEPANAVPFLMEQQWKLNLLLYTVGQRTLNERLHCAGQIAAPVDASAVVSAPVAGRLLPQSKGKLPLLGEAVKAGQTLAFLEPPPPVLTDLAVRALDLQTKALDIERSLAVADARLAFARQEIQRITTLREKGVESEQQADEAKRNLRLAEAEHDSAVALRAKYDVAAKQLTLLQTAAQSVAADSQTPNNLLRVPLEAPISGRIAVAEHVVGEHLETHEEVFRIINLDRVWIVTRVSEFDLGRLPPEPNAIIVPLAFPDRSFDVRQLGGRVINMGNVVEPESRTLALRYELPNQDGVFRAGMFVDVLLETQRATDAVAVPEQAVVMEGGRPVVFVMLEGELFQKREIEVGIRDAGFVEIKNGLSAGERVATRGAYAIKLSSLSGGFGPGHVH